MGNVINSNLAGIKSQTLWVIPVDVSGNALAIATTGSMGSYLPLAGGDMSGNITLQAGVDIIPDSSGNSDLGTAALPFGTIYAATSVRTADVTSAGLLNLQANGNIAIDALGGSIIIQDANIVPDTSGTHLLGTVALPFSGLSAKIVRADVIQGPGGAAQNMIWYENGNIDLASVGGFATFVGGGNYSLINYFGQNNLSSTTSTTISANTDVFINSSGNVRITGSTTLVGDLIPEASGTRNIGSANAYYDTIYVNRVVQTGTAAAGGVTSVQSITGDVLVSGLGSVTVTTAGQAILVSGSASSITQKYNIQPTGAINSSNTNFFLPDTPTSGTLRTYLNGIRINQSGIGLTQTFDYTLSGAVITMLYAPASGSSIVCDYLY